MRAVVARSARYHTKMNQHRPFAEHLRTEPQSAHALCLQQGFPVGYPILIAHICHHESKSRQDEGTAAIDRLVVS